MEAAREVEKRDRRGVRLLSTREYGRRWGMSLDYVGELCREGRLEPKPIKEDSTASRSPWLIPEDAEVIYQDPDELAERRRGFVARARESARKQTNGERGEEG